MAKSATASNPRVIFDARDFADLKAKHGTNAELCELFIRAYVAMLSDSPLGDVRKVDVYARFARALCKDLRLIIRSYSALADALLQSCSMHLEETSKGILINGIAKTPIAREYYSFRKSGDPELLRYIVSFLYFGKKLRYEDSQLQSDALREWLTIEQELSCLRFDDDKTARLAAVMKQLIDVKAFDDGWFMPKFGPGYVSEGLVDPSEKFEQLRLGRQTAYTFRPMRFGRHEDEWKGALTVIIPRGLGKEGSGRFKLVWKNIKTMRSIVMEPNDKMYCQQAVRRWLDDMMDNSVIRHFVDLNDQQPNQRYAIAGSFNYSCDTIDLSAASDRIHVDLVRKIFPKKILYYLLGTRTSKVKTPVGLVSVKKFAPMGSALCFPIQTMVFTAIVLMSYLEEVSATEAADWDVNFSLKKFIKKRIHFRPEDVYLNRYIAPRVFGDDIICDSRITDRVICNLEHFGLKVNESKSFMGSQNVRESCGVYAYEGEVITPSIFRIKEGRGMSGKRYASFVGNINNLYEAGYKRTRSLLIHELQKEFDKARIPRDLIYFDGIASESGIRTTNLHKPKEIRVRENSEWQRSEREVVIVSGIRLGNEIPDMYAYDIDRLARQHDNSTGFFEPVSRRRPSAVGIRRSWIPAE